MNILISGASGMVGTHLLSLLRASGHVVTRLVRRAPTSADERQWAPDKRQLDPAVFRDIQAVINLAGDNIGDGRWTEAKKQRILQSRTQSTSLLAETMAGLDEKPEVFVSVSAVGYYGSRGSEILTEHSSPGCDFLSEVCLQWEASALPARDAGIRVVHPRFGMILSRHGGALSRMLLPFKLGAGGRMGDGTQYWSWITLDDASRVVIASATNGALNGPVNATAPQPVTNLEFTKTLGQVLRRPTFLPVPAAVLKKLLGEMADALILASNRAVPDQLQGTGHTFLYPELTGALKHVLGK